MEENFFYFPGWKSCHHQSGQPNPVFICTAICRTWNAQGQGIESERILDYKHHSQRVVYLVHLENIITKIT